MIDVSFEFQIWAIKIEKMQMQLKVPYTPVLRKYACLVITTGDSFSLPSMIQIPSTFDKLLITDGTHSSMHSLSIILFNSVGMVCMHNIVPVEQGVAVMQSNGESDIMKLLYNIITSPHYHPRHRQKPFTSSLFTMLTIVWQHSAETILYWDIERISSLFELLTINYL